MTSGRGEIVTGPTTSAETQPFAKSISLTTYENFGRSISRTAREGLPLAVAEQTNRLLLFQMQSQVNLYPQICG